MAKKTTLNLENLNALGVERLARLVIDASARDAGFRKYVVAALASANGPEAIAALIDQRLGALERARSFVEWDRARTFASDLSMTVHAIVDELGPAQPALAVERLLRFIATHSGVFERIDDSQGRVQDIYETAIDALSLLVTATSESERLRLPDVIMAKLGEETHGYLPMVVSAVAQSLPPEALVRWDSELGAKQARRPTGKRENVDSTFDPRSFAVIACRQAIAEARSDLDGFVALEQMKHPNLQNASDIAERMLASGRTREALEWVRRAAPHRIGFVSNDELSDGRQMQDLSSIQRVSLEARILDTLGDRRAAQALRWASFEATLDVGILREHVIRLEDFAEFEVLDRAFDHASSAKASYSALMFFIGWPRLDRAGKLVVDRRNTWDGRRYEVLVPAAEALEYTHPAAATILYRALLTDILSRAKSAAYTHAARYLMRLDDLAANTDAAAIPDISTHATFKAEIAKAHGRKSGFWAHVRGDG
jgi:hypothetical protein